MSFVTAQPELVAFAAADLHGIGLAVAAGNTAAAAPATGVVPAAADEVSALTAPIITATTKPGASQQPHPWATAHKITRG